MNKRQKRVNRVIRLLRQRKEALEAKPPVVVGFLKGGRPP
jgi:hypothetical protein